MLNRRRFFQGFAGSLLLPGAPRLWAADGRPGNELEVPQFDLTIQEWQTDITGTPRRTVLVNGGIPAPTLRMRQGDEITIRVHNQLREPTSIHWHGFIVPADMDGVPGLSFDGIAPRSTFTYRFKVNQSGTYWYHSHSRFQEQVGLYGAIVVEPRAGERHTADREYVLLLSDWTDHDPEHLYATLKKQSDYFNYHKRTLGDGLPRAERRMWNSMRMDPTDLADVGGAEYTYLLNGCTRRVPWSGTFTPGERVRLRII